MIAHITAQAVESGAVTQIVMTSPVLPAAPVPGWTVIVPIDDPTVPGGRVEAGANGSDGGGQKPRRRRAVSVPTPAGAGVAVGAAPSVVAPPPTGGEVTEIDLFG